MQDNEYIYLYLIIYLFFFRVKTEQECNTVQTCHSATQYDSYGKAIDNCHDEVKCKQVRYF